ncbi:MAG: ATP-binding cassette domain-containing protein [Methanobacteriaceae archaeon]|nr:ATP-binding cassette domain-containing protein [Methanobacteriaceae archaeon]
MDKTILEFNGVTKEYKDAETRVVSLNGINFKLKKNSLNLINGFTGSGKTTIFNLITLMDIPSDGNIFLDDVILSGLSNSERTILRREKIGSFLRYENLMPYLSVLENVMLPMITTDKEKALKILEVVGLSDKIDTFPEGLSTHEKQITALARAMINDPLIIVADEPFADLDDENTLKLMKLLNKIKNITSFIILSDSDVLKQYFDRVFILKKGKLVENKN